MQYTFTVKRNAKSGQLEILLQNGDIPDGEFHIVGHRDEMLEDVYLQRLDQAGKVVGELKLTVPRRRG